MSTAMILALVAAFGILALNEDEIWGRLGAWEPLVLAAVGFAFVYFGLAAEGPSYVDFFFGVLAFAFAVRSHPEVGSSRRDSR